MAEKATHAILGECQILHPDTTHKFVERSWWRLFQNIVVRTKFDIDLHFYKINANKQK